MSTTGTNYTRARWPDRWRVFGVPLRPFSLGHAMLLEALGNPFVCGGKKVTLHQALMLAFVCSRSFAAAERAVLHQRLPLHWAIGAWLLHHILARRPAWFAPRVLMLRDYIQDSTDNCPESWQTEKGSGRELGTPGLLALKIASQITLGWTEERVLDTPLAQLQWECLCTRELRGEVQLVNETESEAGRMTFAE